MTSTSPNFRDRFLAQERLFGTFLKIPASMPAEILGSLGFDFVVVDEEHSPFNRETTDLIVLACRAVGIGAVVRVQSPDPAGILSVLDCGADGILVPHVTDADTARAIVAAARYRRGKRGFAPTTRAGTFGADNTTTHITKQDARVTVIAMIEDPEAIENIDEILAVEGLDGVFIGRGDLSVAYEDYDGSTGVVAKATARVQAAAKAKGKTVAILPGGPEDAAARAADGASAFILSSDQGFLRAAAKGAHVSISAAVNAALKGQSDV
ncbi:HpcH/HpaI aldolase family protein [Thalassovita sp.]|uniref:HpcH/HpaI aldolase family protein n=1 Tax=Thalassovita sp. TaxID=1979401 RepID=UPI003B58ECBA